MKLLIVISNPIDIENEHEHIHSLFDNGLECFHLRKPEKTKDDYEAFLKKINPKYYKRIVIHSHYSLIDKYNLKGVHLPERMLNEDSAIAMVKPMKRYGFTISGSIHSIDQIEVHKDLNYLFLSPVFDSISKDGYRGQIDLAEFKSYKAQNSSTTKIIALGGVNDNNLPKTIDTHFDGMALLGVIWNDPEGLNEFIKIKSKLEEVSNS